MRVATQTKWENLGTPQTHQTDEYSFTYLLRGGHSDEEGGKCRRTPERSYDFSRHCSFLPSSLTTVSDVTHHVSSPIPGTGETDESGLRPARRLPGQQGR